MEVRLFISLFVVILSTCFCQSEVTDPFIDSPYFSANYVPPPTKGNVFAAISHMQPLVNIERKLVEKAKDYLREERQKLNGMKQFAEAVEKSMVMSKDDPVKYLGNPVNSYLIIKRFTSGWKELLGRLSVDDSKVKEISKIIRDNEDNLPRYEDDLLGSIAALLRLMDTYEITAKEIVDGEIKGVKKSLYQMSVSDIIEIVELAHNAKRYNRMMEYFYEAERIMTNKNLRAKRAGNFTMKSYHEYGAWCEYLNGDMKKALYHTERVLKIDPTNAGTKKNKEFYEFYVRENTENLLTAEQWDFREDIQNDKLFRRGRYASSCRGNFSVKLLKSYESQVCFYKKDKPRLILKPFKVTRVHDNPEVLIFHNIVAQKEMDEIIRIATPELAPAQVVDIDTQQITTAPYRISKSMWLTRILSQEKELLANKLDRITEDATNLNPEYSESYQVQNYGLGGQYEFHHDHGEPGSYLDIHPDGNRIATLLYYISDVEKGGHTVFTRLGITSYVNKGDAIMWHNLYKNGTGNPLTEHAGCPVISGSKWVMNKWLKMRSGEKTHLCALNRLE